MTAPVDVLIIGAGASVAPRTHPPRRINSGR
jgi:hypothetical protein